MAGRAVRRTVAHPAGPRRAGGRSGATPRTAVASLADDAGASERGSPASIARLVVPIFSVSPGASVVAGDPLAIDERAVQRPQVLDLDPVGNWPHNRVAPRDLGIVDDEVGIRAPDDELSDRSMRRPRAGPDVIRRVAIGPDTSVVEETRSRSNQVGSDRAMEEGARGRIRPSLCSPSSPVSSPAPDARPVQVVGRDPGAADVVLDEDAEVSRRHAAFSPPAPA